MLANVEGYDYMTYHITSMEEKVNSHEEFYQLNDIEDLKLFADDIRQLYYDNKLNAESLSFPSMNSILTWESSTMTFGADNSGNESLHMMAMVCKKITIDDLRIPCFLYINF
jgi:predicted alpha/beta-fold hydrolase